MTKHQAASNRPHSRYNGKRLANVLFIGFYLLTMLFPTNTQAQDTRVPTMLSVKEILSNYGLDSSWVDDTAAIVGYLAEQPQDYATLTSLCVSIRTKAQKVINSIENDYQHLDSLIWIDENTVLSDYNIYEYRLRRLAELMGRKSIYYSRMEQKRIEAEKEAARQRALDEARQKQEERDAIADGLRSNIDLHNRAIIKATLGTGITDKNKLKELKDIYYSYLMVYNKYDLTPTPATDEMILRLDELNSFQNDLLEKVLGENSLPHQIDNFKNVLKVRCGDANNDVYRSYTRVFKHTSVPVSFADVSEYSDYINRLQTVAAVQARYLQTLDLRATIEAGSAAIESRYGKKYRDALYSYRNVLASLNQVPAFTTNAESLIFIHSLEDFIEAQQIYIDDYAYMEEISERADTILRGSHGRFRDVSEAYRNAEPALKVMPAFRDAAGASIYESRLEEVRQVQRCYLTVLELREEIANCDDSLAVARKTDRILANGYRTLRRQQNLQPQFSTVERGAAFIEYLQRYLEMQRLCISTMEKLNNIAQNDAIIDNKDNIYRNIVKAYQRTKKVYQGLNEINNTEELRRYSLQCDNVLEMQEAFIKTLRSETAADIDKKLRQENDLSRIRLAVGLQ